MMENLSKIEKCKQLPRIEKLEDCMAFYKLFFKYKLFDANYGAKDHKDYRDKPFEELSLDEVLTSFTIIQREDYWNGGYDSAFERYLENKTFEKLYNRLQELIKEVDNEI